VSPYTFDRLCLCVRRRIDKIVIVNTRFVVRYFVPVQIERIDVLSLYVKSQLFLCHTSYMYITSDVPPIDLFESILCRRMPERGYSFFMINKSERGVVL